MNEGGHESSLKSEHIYDDVNVQLMMKTIRTHGAVMLCASCQWSAAYARAPRLQEFLISTIESHAKHLKPSTSFSIHHIFPRLSFSCYQTRMCLRARLFHVKLLHSQKYRLMKLATKQKQKRRLQEWKVFFLCSQPQNISRFNLLFHVKCFSATGRIGHQQHNNTLRPFNGLMGELPREFLRKDFCTRTFFLT